MSGYAVIETGGKQYRVVEGSVLEVERLNAEVGKKVELERVLALSTGKSLKIGTPIVSGATVTAEVVEHLRGDKIIAFKKKRRKGYARKVGHRQELTRLRIAGIKKARAAKAKQDETPDAGDVAPAQTAEGQGD